MNTTGAALALKGLDSRHKPEAGTARRCVHLTWDLRGGWKEGPGFRRLLDERGDQAGVNAFTGVGAITSLHMLQMGNGARTHLLFENDNSELLSYNPSNIRTTSPWDSVVDSEGTAITNRTIIGTPWQRTQSVAWGNRLYLVNGHNQALVWNGRYAERAGWDAIPQAPFAYVAEHSLLARYKWDGAAFALDAIDNLGVGNTDFATAYGYAVSWVNERGQESPLSPVSGLVDVPAGSLTVVDSLVAVNIQVPLGPSHCVARRLYRTANLRDSSGNLVTAAGSSSLYLLDTIEDNITTIYEDILPDSALGALVDPLDLGPWPAGAKYIANWGGCLWLAGMIGGEVRYSAPGYPEVFPVDNVFSTSDTSGGPITGFYPTRSSLLVFKNSSIHRISGNPVDGFRIQTLVRTTGCAAPNTICEVPGLGVVFLSESGVRAIVGARDNSDTPVDTIDLSEPISDQVQRLNRSALMNACACVYRKDREVWFAVPTLGSAVNNLVLVLHYDIGQWSTRTGFPISCMLETQDSRGYLIFGSHDTTGNNLGLHVVSHGWATAGTTTISPVYETNDLDLGYLYRNLQPRHLMVFGLAIGNNDLTVNYRVNRSMSNIRPSSEGKDQQNPNEVLAVYGTATWGSSTWGEQRAAVFRYDVQTTTAGPVHEVRFALSPSGRRLYLIGLDIERANAEQSNVKPLNATLNSGTRG